jgi:hypothetical protein
LSINTYTCREALALMGGSLAAMAIAENAAHGATGIKTGVHPYPLANPEDACTALPSRTPTQRTAPRITS